jgi:hypothetical protein
MTKLQGGPAFQASSSRSGWWARHRSDSEDFIYTTGSDDDLGKVMGMAGVCKSQVSRLCQDRLGGQNLPRPPDQARLALPAIDAT